MKCYNLKNLEKKDVASSKENNENKTMIAWSLEI